ncbi:MAG TPA: hypothetical protein PK263_00090 [bacterium]|nr:hypothetical protein [bacterium]
MKNLKICLLGSIPKGDKERKSYEDWREEYKKEISKTFPNAKFLSGDDISDNVGPELVVGHDLSLIKRANFIIVNASTKVGAGTAQEMVIAKYFKKPVISIMPRDTHNRRSNIAFHDVTMPEWIHPFLFVSSDFIAENIEEAVDWIKKTKEEIPTIKDFSIYEKLIESFESVNREQ